MLDPKTLPTIMIVLSILSAAHHACVNPTDWRHIGYWLCAAGLNYCVTY